MILDCYEFYLWSIGELPLPPKEINEPNETQERKVTNEF